MNCRECVNHKLQVYNDFITGQLRIGDLESVRAYVMIIHKINHMNMKCKD